MWAALRRMSLPFFRNINRCGTKEEVTSIQGGFGRPKRSFVHDAALSDPHLAPLVDGFFLTTTGAGNPEEWPRGLLLSAVAATAID